MKVSVSTALRLFLSLSAIFAISSCGISKRASGTDAIKIKSRNSKAAPAECIAAFQEFFAYVRDPGQNIAADPESQNRWLAASLRKALAGYAVRAEKSADNPDYPSNSMFLGVWERPTTFTVIGTRHYDFHNSDNPNDNRAIIDVLYEWDKTGGVNNYTGEKSIYSFIFIYEDGAWKLDDLYTYSDAYASAESLKNFLSEK